MSEKKPFDVSVALAISVVLVELFPVFLSFSFSSVLVSSPSCLFSSPVVSSSFFSVSSSCCWSSFWSSWPLLTSVEEAGSLESGWPSTVVLSERCLKNVDYWGII